MARPTLNLETLRPETSAAWIIALTLEKFNIWAARGIQVVWSDPAVGAFAQFLVDYAEGWLGANRKACPAFIREEHLLSELRLRLMERVEHWKSEAFRYVTAQKAHAQAVDGGADPTVDSVSSIPQQVGEGLLSANDTETKSSRRAAVDAYIQNCARADRPTNHTR